MGQSTKEETARTSRQQISTLISRHKEVDGRNMVRSVWKGPFVEGSLLKRQMAQRAFRPHD